MRILSTIFGILSVVIGVGILPEIEYKYRVKIGLLTGTFAVGVIFGVLWTFVISSGG